MQRYIQHNKERKSGLFVYLLILTALFAVFEISFFIQCNQLYLGDFKLVSDHLKIPATVLPGILFFMAVQLILHLLFTVIIWAMARLVGAALNCSWSATQKLGFQLWIIGILSILLANQFFYPNSKYGNLISFLLNPVISKGLLIVFILLLTVASIISLWGLIQVSSQRWKRILGLFSFSWILGTLWMTYHQETRIIQQIASREKPNIILIGIDSLRPDYLGYFGHEKITPYLDNFLNQATVFADAFTPLARTFPSWASILSGRYPKQTGIRTNLATLNDVDLKNTLPNILRGQGYETIFATDETRFSNIDQRFGFDAVLTPPMGFNDFLVGTINDFPFSNLLVNTSIGKSLFPYSYANRPVYATYDPNSFLNLLKPTLEKTHTKPLFLAVHFCLPHYPYSWNKSHVNEKNVPNYQSAVQRVDEQVNDFLILLTKNKLLEHSIVVLLSDHGEAMELVGDRVTDPALFIAGADNKKRMIPRFYPPSVESEAANRSAGHGTDVLGLSQYHSVLAFRLYGLENNQIATIPGLVSLMDIKPTLLSLLNIEKVETNGSSLKNIILGKQSFFLNQQDFFIESDFSPEAVRSIHPETRKLLFEGIDFFQINPATTRLTVKSSMENMILTSKQYADIYNKWVLALYPQNKTSMMPILVDLSTGRWTNDLRTPFAKTSPAKHMLQALKRFYGSEITQIKNL